MREHLASECYGQAKEEGANIESVWQDGDSSSGKSVKEIFPNGQVLKCGGHVGRAHTNNLKDFSKMKEFSSEMKRKYKDKFPLVETTKCKSFNTRHKSDCGCLSEAFIKAAGVDHFCCLQQCKDPSEYAQRMRALGKYHARDEHKWDDGQCGFHPQEHALARSAMRTRSQNVLARITKLRMWSHVTFIGCATRLNVTAELKMQSQSFIWKWVWDVAIPHFTVLPQFRAKDQSLNR